MIFDFEIRCGARLRMEATTRYVFVDPATLRKAAPPASVREVYAALLPPAAP